MSSETRRIVIVGGGLAGAKAAETLRETGFDGELTIVGDESERPYERPPLSKEYLRGEAATKPHVHPEGFYAGNGIELLTAMPVTAIDTDAREVALGDGRRLAYDRLLLATGAAPRRIDVPGVELDGIHHLRTLADSEAIAAAIEAAERLVVVGSGWIGAEIAASARAKGCEVTMVEMASLPLERVLGAAARPVLSRSSPRPRNRVPARDDGRALRGRGLGRARSHPRRRGHRRPGGRRRRWGCAANGARGGSRDPH